MTSVFSLIYFFVPLLVPALWRSLSGRPAMQQNLCSHGRSPVASSRCAAGSRSDVTGF